MTTATRKLMLGDSANGYDTALVTTTASGKYRLVPGSLNGRVWHIKRAVAALNRDRSGYVTRAGDEKSIYLSKAAE